ncbi:MAG: hypothetical protein AAF845_05850 [Bacteroidota bacterium]
MPRLPTLLFVAALASAAALLLGLHGTARGTDMLMEKFHLRHDGPIPFAVMQVLPSMYNFENEWWWSDPVSATSVTGSLATPLTQRPRHIPHYPTAAAVGPERSYLVSQACMQDLEVRTRARGRTLRTRYRFSRTPRGIQMTRAALDAPVTCTP